MDPVTFVRIILLSAVLAFPSPSPVPGATPTAANMITYTVRQGDTLIGIAIRFNTTVEAIQQANGLKTDQLQVGQQLKIPVAATATPTPPPATTAPGATPAPGAATTYTVRAGDTLASIAARFGLTVDELAAANNIRDPNTIAVGQVLTIPKKGPTPTPTPLPQGLEVIPGIPRQGQTLEVKITAPGATTASGTFLGQQLQFLPANGYLYALVGISRCAQTGSALLLLRTDAPEVQARTLNVTVAPGGFPAFNIVLSPQMAAALSDPVAERQENDKIIKTVNQFSPEQYWTGKFISPLPGANLAAVTSAQFGERRSYNGGPVGACGHEGQDFAVPAGTPVVAPAPGKIVLAELHKVRGNVVFIDHGHGVYSGFYHLSKILVQAGQMVKAGDNIAQVGSTGFSTGDHLHWSVWVGGEYVDPLEWLNRTIP